jgi:hypothetical protein
LEAADFARGWAATHGGSGAKNGRAPVRRGGTVVPHPRLELWVVKPSAACGSGRALPRPMGLAGGRKCKGRKKG